MFSKLRHCGLHLWLSTTLLSKLVTMQLSFFTKCSLTDGRIKRQDKTDKSCIILIRILDYDVGYVRTRFLDMPVVNIGTARNLFDALKSSLSEKGLDFEKCIAFISNTTNVMKGV